MAYFYLSQPARSFYRPPTRWTWGSEYDPFDLFSEFIGHHPTSLLGFPTLTVPSLTAGVTRPHHREERKWHKVVRLPPYFGPEDFTVKTEGRILKIQAVQEEKAEDGGVDRCEVRRQVEVPEQVDMDTVKTLWLKTGGILVVGELQKPKPVEGAQEGTTKPKEEPKQVTKDSEGQAEAAAQAEGGEKKQGLKRELSIDVENFGSQMKSFAQDVHEALFGDSLPQPHPDEVIPMEFEDKGEGEKEEPKAKGAKGGEPEEIKLDVTGYKPDEVKVSVNKGVVSVTGSHTEEDQDHVAEYHFERSFTLPDDAVASKVSSKIDEEKNTLVISVPREPKAIEYKSS